jgi:hypothetical protein
MTSALITCVVPQTPIHPSPQPSYRRKISDMASIIPASKSIGQLIFASALSTYGLYLSYENITRLQQFEKQSEKAAEWSNTAAQRLHKTRTTQASGTISVRQQLTALSRVTS